MKKIAFINTYCNGSTGGLINVISKYLPEKSFLIKKFYGRCFNDDRKDWSFIGENAIFQKISNVMTYLTGEVGSFHKSSTRKLIKQLKLFNPDIIHIHNIHGNYLNFKMLFEYLSHFTGKIIFTMHDEFFLSGRCALMGCEKWKTGCHSCKKKNEYPHVLIDKSSKLQKEKESFVASLHNPVFVFPSEWLAKLFNNKYSNVKKVVINNGVETKKIEKKQYLNKNNVKLLCVANPWSIDKGSNFINELRNMLPPSYLITVVGTDNKTKKLFDKNVCLTGVLNKEELEKQYLSADIFINPTLKDNFPTVLLESLSYGLPIISFNTGGCSEIVTKGCGLITSKKDANSIYCDLISFDFKENNSANCFKRANDFAANKCADKYLSLYTEKTHE